LLITVYSKPNCAQCDATKKHLDKLGVHYTVFDVSEDEKALNFIVGMGYKAAPVVVAGFNHWSGFRPDLIKEHIVGNEAV